jgi:hypothetical protein
MIKINYATAVLLLWLLLGLLFPGEEAASPASGGSPADAWLGDVLSQLSPK